MTEATRARHGEATPGEGWVRDAPSRRTFGQWGWRLFCRLVVLVLYRRLEVEGLEKIPRQGPVLLCANHFNALIDGVILQVACPRPIHPLARSGLFGNPWMRPILRLLQAVPVYRRQDPGSDPGRNVDSFARCYELLARGEVLLIFPEGQSHSDSHLRPLKTGASRIALGARAHTGRDPVLLPIGLTFPQKGKFRSTVLVQIGDAVPLPPPARPGSGEPSEPSEPSEPGEPGEPGEQQVRELTAKVEEGLAKITLNVDSWEDFDLLWRLERFFAFRRGRRPQRHSLGHRFRALKRLIPAHRILRLHAPERVQSMRRLLEDFERLRSACGVRDYHLKIRYTPSVVARYLARLSFFLLVILPVGLWGLLNSSVPFLLTRHLSRRSARGVDQYDTAKVLVGASLYLAFWGGQTFAVFWYFDLRAALAYVLSLPVSAALALLLLRERALLLGGLRVFFLFLSRRELRTYLVGKRKEVERELARLARFVKTLPQDSSPNRIVGENR